MPQNKPQSKAVISNIKLNDHICTNVYVAVAMNNPFTLPYCSANLCWTKPRQNISSAGPIIKI